MFSPKPDSVAEIRAFTRRATSALDPAVQDDVVLMVSELATNALLHAEGGIDVAIDCTDQALQVSVTDGGNGIPVLQPADLLRPFGRGLRIVDELSDDWGSSRSDVGGTVVWFRLNLDRQPDAHER